jgi:hypothetical protein
MPTSQRTILGRWLRYGLVAFIGLSCLRVWLAPAGVDGSAHAQVQIPDSLAQRTALLAEARRTNQLLSDIKEILSSGRLNVVCKGADNKGADN